jgi:hypothetical protein
MNNAARQIIAALELEPLPGEGGYFRQTWRSDTASAIFFLLTPENFSAFHRLAQHETWHFYGGDNVEHVQLNARSGASLARVAHMGSSVLAGEQPQVHVAPGVWQGARIAAGGSHGWSLLGCTVSPPWDERGFELAARDTLLTEFPSEAAWIHALTR